MAKDDEKAPAKKIDQYVLSASQLETWRKDPERMDNERDAAAVVKAKAAIRAEALKGRSFVQVRTAGGELLTNLRA